MFPNIDEVKSTVLPAKSYSDVTFVTKLSDYQGLGIDRSLVY